MASPFPRWNDDRLDELARKVDRMDRNMERVIRLDEKMGATVEEMKEYRKQMKAVTEQLEQAVTEPGRKAQEMQSRVFIAIIAAVSGGVVTVIAALIGGGLGH